METRKPCPLCGGEPRAMVRGASLSVDYCSACRLGFQPSIPADSGAQYRTLDYYGAWWRDRGADEESTRQAKRLGSRWVLSRLAPYLKPGARVLEVGCALGYFLEEANAAGYRASGLETNPEAVREARSRGLDVEEGTDSDLERKAGEFDAVVFLDVIEHVVDPARAIGAARRALRAGGVLALVTPDVESAARRLLGSRWPHYKPEHLFYFSRPSLSSLCRQAGFESVAFESSRKGASLKLAAAHASRYKNIPGFAARLLAAAPGASSAFLWPSELFALARAPKTAS